MSDLDEAPIEEIREQLEQWNMGLDELQSTVERAGADRRAKLKVRLDALREDFERAKATFEELSQEDGSRWDEFRDGMEKGRRLVDQALEEVGSESSS